MCHFRDKYARRDPQYYDVINYRALYQCAKDCMRDVTWKASVQAFGIDMSAWVGRLHNSLVKGTYRSFGFTHFIINERGKMRHIQSVHISERTVQKSLCNNALKPIVEPLLIDTNTASRKGMGTQKAIGDLIKHLQQHYEKHGLEGGILIMDLHDYFHSINHKKLLKKYRKIIKDDRIFDMIKYFVECFDEGLGLGSEISQISAIFYPNDIDHYVVDELGLSYGRFMDDSYVICEDLDLLRKVRDILFQMYADLDIEMNLKKTQIIAFKKGSFEYLKKRFKLTETGEIIIRPVRKVFNKWRRTLKKQHQKWLKGEITIEAIEQSYNSRRGGLEKYNCQRSLWEMDKLFMRLFNEMPNGETIEDICMRKQLYYYKRLYDKHQIYLDDIGEAYLSWKQNAEWFKHKRTVIKRMNKLVYQLFGRPYNHLKEGDQWYDKYAVTKDAHKNEGADQRRDSAA